MSNKIKTGSHTKRKRGRPRVNSTQISLRLPPYDLGRLDKWIKTFAPKETRQEVIRRFISFSIGYDETMR